MRGSGAERCRNSHEKEKTHTGRNHQKTASASAATPSTPPKPANAPTNSTPNFRPGSFPYVLLDARYEKIRHGGQALDCAVLFAIGINPQGKRSVLGVSVALSEAEVHWRDFRTPPLPQRSLPPSPRLRHHLRNRRRLALLKNLPQHVTNWPSPILNFTENFLPRRKKIYLYVHLQCK